MRSLIVPCAGSQMINGLPLYLNHHPEGVLLALKAITGIFPESYDRIIFAILKEANLKYNAQKIIKNAMNGQKGIEIFCLSERTKGPADTIYQTIKEAGVKGEFAVRDSHVFIELDKPYTGNFIAGLDLTTYEQPVENLRSKSFITLNEQKQVMDVVEKHFCSDIISVGLYGFKNADDFLFAYEHLNDSNYSISKLYISHIISYLIGYSQRVFHAAMITKFEDWSSETAWNKVQKTHATCFLNIDNICGIPYSTNINQMKKLIDLSKSGIKFIGFTHRNGDTSKEFEFLKSNGVNVLSIVGGCSHSKEYALIHTLDELYAFSLEV